MTDGRTPDPAYAKEPRKKSQRARLALSLLRSLAGGLGWRYWVYIPGGIALATAFLLPPRFLQFFTEQAETLDQVSGQQLVLRLAGFGLAIAVALWLSTLFGGLLREWLRLRVSLQLRSDSLEAIHATPLETFDDAHRGDWMTRVTSDLHNVEDFLSDSLPQQVQSFTLVIGSAVLFLMHSGPLALIPCLAAIGLAGLNARVQRRMAPTLTTARELEGEVFQDLMESYEGWRTIRSAGAESSVAARFKHRLESVRAAGMRIIRSMAGLMGINEFAGQIVTTLVLSLLAWSLKQGDLTVSDVLVYPFFIGLFLGNARSLAASAYDWNRFLVEGGRLAELLNVAPPIPSATDDSSEPIPATTRSIVIRHLSAGYAGKAPLFTPINLTLSRGEILAITGPSGSGKSTLLEILAGLREPRGGTFSGIENPSDSPLAALPSTLGAFVEQRPYFFVGSLRENLTLGLSSERVPGDATIERTLASLGLDDAIRNRGGLAMNLTDRGQNFSEGQRYRLALCRALLTDRPFLWLDEPFASVDPESVRRMVIALEEERQNGRGIVIATHQVPVELHARRFDLLDATQPENRGVAEPLTAASLSG